MTPTAFKVAQLDVQQDQLKEAIRHNAAEERERQRANTLNFVGSLVGSAAGIAGKALGRKVTKITPNVLNYDNELVEFDQLMNERSKARLSPEKFSRLRELARLLHKDIGGK